MSEIIVNKKPNKPRKENKTEIEKKNKTFLSYLDDFRKLFFRSFIIVILFTIVAFMFKSFILGT